MTQNICVSVQMDEKSFHDFASFDLLRHNKGWQRPAVFTAILLVCAGICLSQIGKREGAGLLTAVLSPLVNSALFAMPAPAVLPAILTKSPLLAAAAGFAARKFRRVSLLLLLGVVLFYQVIGSAAEWGLTGSLAAALQDFRIGIPGMLLQILGGYLFIKYLK